MSLIRRFLKFFAFKIIIIDGGGDDKIFTPPLSSLPEKRNDEPF